jgi:hypothetical protein
MHGVSLTRPKEVSGGATVFCAARSLVFLILLSIRIEKKEYNTEHDAPVGLADAQLDDLVNSDHQEHYREGE